MLELQKAIPPQTQGRIRYRVVKLNEKAQTPSIIIECPICGREGRLCSGGSRSYGRMFKVRHILEDGRLEVCSISRGGEGAEYYDEIKRIYESVRSGRRW